MDHQSQIPNANTNKLNRRQKKNPKKLANNFRQIPFIDEETDSSKFVSTSRYVIYIPVQRTWLAFPPPPAKN